MVKLFVPFLIYLMTFSTYLNYVYDFRDDSSLLKVINVNFQVVLVFLSLYFSWNEFKQLFMDGLDYFTSIWNYLDIGPPIIIMLLVAMDHYE